jgi:hypothetical protein
MNDAKSELRRAMNAAPAIDGNLDAVYRRRAQKERRARAATFAVVACVVVGAGALITPVLRGDPDGVVARSGDVLGRPTADLALPNDAFYYERISVQGAVFERWWGPDDSGRIVQLERTPDYGVRDGRFGPGEFYSDSGPVADLSTDPVDLERQLRERVEPTGASPEPYEDWGGPVEWGLIRSIRELLQAPDVMPAQKAALVQVAATLDVVTVDMSAKDPTGRDAFVLISDTENAIHKWWFDPATHQLLAMDDGWTVLHSGIAPDTSTTKLDPVFVDRD